MHKEAVHEADNHLAELGRLMGEALGGKRTSGWVGNRSRDEPAKWGDVRPGRDEAISILMARVEVALKRRLSLDSANWCAHARGEVHKRVDRVRAQVDDKAGSRWGRKQRKRQAIEAMASIKAILGPRPWVAEGEAAVWGKGSPTGTEQGDRS